jgi:STE24 endopeptidase
MNESKATRYQRMQRRAQSAAWLLGGLTLALVAFTPLGRWLYDSSVGLAAVLPTPLRSAVSLLVFISLVTAVCELAVLPTELYRLRWVDPAYGRPDAGSVQARLVGTLALLPAVVAGGALVLLSGGVAPGVWWLLAGVLLSIAFACAVRIGPLILGGLGDVRPLTRPDLTARIEALARRVGVPVAGIQEWQVGEGSPTVAMVAGVGRGRRVLLASDVVRHWSEDEITVVVAHELAHHVHHDLLRSLALNALVLCVGLLGSELLIGWAGPSLRIEGAHDPVSLPVIGFAVLVVWLVATPLRHAQSRRQERRADRFALRSTGHAEAFATAIRRVSARHLVDERPTPITRWLFHRHPSVSERLALAERYLQKRQSGR